MYRIFWNRLRKLRRNLKKGETRIVAQSACPIILFVSTSTHPSVDDHSHVFQDASWDSTFGWISSSKFDLQHLTEIENFVNKKKTSTKVCFFTLERFLRKVQIHMLRQRRTIVKCLGTYFAYMGFFACNNQRN